jgi:hypothetical protein
MSSVNTADQSETNGTKNLIRKAEVSFSLIPSSLLPHVRWYVHISYLAVMSKTAIYTMTLIE